MPALRALCRIFGHQYSRRSGAQLGWNHGTLASWRGLKQARKPKAGDVLLRLLSVVARISLELPLGVTNRTHCFVNYQLLRRKGWWVFPIKRIWTTRSWIVFVLTKKRCRIDLLILSRLSSNLCSGRLWLKETTLTASTFHVYVYRRNSGMCVLVMLLALVPVMFSFNSTQACWVN